MSQDTFQNMGRIFSNVGEMAAICFKVTAAADVAASGYTVNTGKDYVSAVTRDAEGIIKVALRKAFPDYLGAIITNTRQGSHVRVNDATAISTAADPHIHATFRSEAGADEDPDSATLHFIVFVKATKTSFQAT